jgi:serine/threonine protein kinase/tetratricopeptide (TPR) repeat protein
MDISPSRPPDGNLLARGATIGRFQVIALVGKGGMGEVYAAYDPELDRNVAIKLLRAGKNSDSDEGRARMMREAQATARVSHPNVVIVYDAGTFQDRVFIAMEFVEGHTLGYWMHARTRSWPEVLEVFTAAGRGLAAAHERDLVHRDFKPDNVMIGADGQVRVMDFGLVQIAGERHAEEADGDADGASDGRVEAAQEDDVTAELSGPRNGRGGSGPTAVNGPTGTDPDDILTTRALSTGRGAWRGPRTGPNPNLTRFGASVGTPAYMSPEQFRGEPTDAATDQFSFCVALYEALYSERPFAGRTPDDLGKNVVGGFVRTAPQSSRVPAWIREVLLRGLAVNPAGRWPSMTALLAQLEQQPAVASRRRFVAAAAAKLAGVWEVPRGDRPTEIPTRAEIRRAFLATGKPYAKKAWVTTSRILDEYARRWADLYVESCEATHVRNEHSTEVLDLRIGALQEGLEDLKALCRVFRHATPEVVENAVNAANALRGLDRCENIELLRAVVRPPEDAATRAAVARLRTELSDMRALFRVGRLSDALTAAAPLRQQAAALGYAPLLADVLISVASVCCEKGMTDEGTRLYEEALWTALRCRHDETATEAATYLIFPVGSGPSLGEAAETWSRLAETLLERMGGHDLIWSWLLTNRSALRLLQGRPLDSLEDARRAVAAKEKVLGAKHPDLALSLNNLALCLDYLGEVPEAVDQMARAVPIVENGLGADHPRTGWFLSNYSELLNRAGRFAEAGQAAERARAIMEREYDPLIVTYPLVALGASALGLGEVERALAVLERANDTRTAKEPDPARRAEARFMLARALWEQGKDQARARTLAATARDENLQSPDTPARKRALEEIDAWLTRISQGSPSP